MKLPSFITKEQLPFLALMLSPLPVLFFLTLFFFKMQQLNTLTESVSVLEQRALQLSDQKKKEEQLLAKLKKGDANFLEKHLESLSFSSPYPARGGGENRFQFLEENPKNSELLEEVEAKVKQPVLLNEDELKKVLSLIEGVAIGSHLPQERSPQLIIRNFELVKKLDPGQEEAFEVTMQILKREPVKNP
ncbi:MAG: hypothetical protein HYX48_00500 [Chlamydiales bacterium]|nr:hypothetical protein [Chlamydiales bacterium]